ncbi:hypothetical protein L249_3264 [Ophiocordyceps polyrhachis-furcata BCC 54312]|uniref:Uncharacterized protein n=1 Tax=Ophiocordyceps polyrhachis-furcata BCC 54312 TaxID=1330021 RepID=A0A367LPF8_9HYPO|nr:hypothetical protein L249_3264 [Ophiocordyceps polyrhachis-furcata BCC 54312]
MNTENGVYGLFDVVFCWRLQIQDVDGIRSPLEADDGGELVMMRPGRFLMILLSSPSKTSVLTDRSWASSTMMTEYRLRRGSTSASRMRRPSVRNLMRVADDVTSSNRIE